MSRFAAMAIGAFVLLFALAIPWYWRFVPELSTKLIAGFPLWVLTSIGGAALIAALVGWVICYGWPEEEEVSPQGKDSAGNP